MAARRRSHRLVLTARGRVFAASVVVLVVLAYAAGNPVFQLAAALGAALLAAGLIAVRLRRPRLAVARTLVPPLAAAGAPVRVTIAARNRSPRGSGAALWRDRLSFPPGATADAPLAPLASGGVRAGARTDATTLGYTTRPPRRGVVEIGPLEVELEDPFGLVRHTVVAGAAQSVVVTPQLVDLVDAGLGESSSEGEARLVQRAVLAGGDDLMTREYRRGDAMRRVHWRVSARQGELMVRQEEQRSKPEVRLAVDTRRDGYADAAPGTLAAGEAESETFEWVVRMVASIGVHLRQTGYAVSVLESADRQIEPLGAAGAADEPFLTSLATIRLGEARRPDRAPEAGGAVFAVVADPAPETLDWLLALRRPRERAVVFLPERSTTARDALLGAGFTVVLFRPDDDLAAVWAAVALAGDAA
ncbi:DUF58 domain-containing protein [Galbitalea sp. SE-J8]|uniref:DUF58 domain-containing protein n=1 Tax=Galbitalea sp. SE-J8 TaxID=3054952 RepID=UPI00259D221A|nr:DUF58 domain-containing protein [Galbitalea sp. SE-J8]MDM4762942.1 DUF58 domain-containing protein [Galbitalea sp. SE-J8]